MISSFYGKASITLTAIILLLLGVLILTHTPYLLAFGFLTLAGSFFASLRILKEYAKDTIPATLDEELELLSGTVMQAIPPEQQDLLSRVQSARKQLPKDSTYRLLSNLHAKLLSEAKHQDFTTRMQVFERILQKASDGEQLKITISNGNAEIIF